MSYADQYPRKVEDYSNDTEYVVLQEESYSQRDDYSNEQYDYSTVNYLQVLTFKSFETLNKWVQDQEKITYNKKKYKILKVTPYEVEVSIKVAIKQQ